MSAKLQTLNNKKALSKQQSPQPMCKNLYSLTKQTHPATVMKRAWIDTSLQTPLDVLQLQRAIGNHAVESLLTGVIQNQPAQAKLTVNKEEDKYKQEADSVVNEVLKKYNPSCSKCKEKENLQKKTLSGNKQEVTPFLASRIQSIKDGGNPLPLSIRDYFEPRFGTDFSHVRIHEDFLASQTAQSINAKAFTTGRNIVFNAGQYSPKTEKGKKLLAHELTHVVQQQGTGKRVQRYEAGEHAELGETQAELKSAFAPTSYVVQKGDRLSTIAKKFGITVSELKDANKDKLKKWPAKDRSGRMIEGFSTGEKVSIPKKLSTFARAATKDISAKFTVNGVVLDYGVGMAMGDFFESPEQMAKASPKELKALSILIKREQTAGKPVTTQEWQIATGGRYLKLAEKNVAHFAPPSPGLVKPSAAGAASANFKSEWEKHHKAALGTSKTGDKDKALMTNAYADHFLTDAFCSGHLVNKRDVMEQFKSQLKTTGKGEAREFTKSSKKFFDDVAKDAFKGAVKTEFSKYKTEMKYWGVRPNIDSVGMFSRLLQGIHMEEPDLLASAVAKGVHDMLNIMPGGLPVENTMGDSWNLSGDGSLNAKTKEIARKAVAQSQVNIISVFKSTTALNYTAVYKKVWAYTPKPSKAGIKQLVATVKKGTDAKSSDLKRAVVDLIKANYKLIIDELVKRKKLRKA